MHLVRIYEGSEGGGTFGERSFIGSGYTKVTRRSRGAHAPRTALSASGRCKNRTMRSRRRPAEQPECRAYCEYREYPECRAGAGWNREGRVDGVDRASGRRLDRRGGGPRRARGGPGREGVLAAFVVPTGALTSVWFVIIPNNVVLFGFVPINVSLFVFIASSCLFNNVVLFDFIPI